MSRRKTAQPEATETTQNQAAEPAQNGQEQRLETATQSETATKSERPDRGWTQRLSPPEVAYRRFTAKDQTGRSKIFIQFQLPQGQDKPDAEALAVVQAHKQTPEGYDTGLRFEEDYIYGKAWKLPNNEIGRSTADSIDKGLQEVAVKLEGLAR